MGDHEHKEGKSHGGGHGAGAHGGSHEEHEGAPEWLISFADNVVLLMGFFVIMLAMNIGMKGSMPHGDATEENKNGHPSAAMLDLQIAIREAFNNPVDEGNPRDAILVARMRERKNQGQTDEPGPDGTKHDLQSIRPSDYIAPCGVIAFDDSSAQMTSAAHTVVADVARMTAGHRFIVEVRGHVSTAESFRTSDNGMELSFRRALAAANALRAAGVARERIRVVACADGQRVVGRAQDPGEHQTNQRVEIFETSEAMASDPYTQGRVSSAEPGADEGAVR